MLSCTAASSGITLNKETDRLINSPASKIFKEFYQYPFEVDMMHFRMHGGTQNFPIIGAKTQKDIINEASRMVGTRGRIIDMCDYFHDDAVLAFPDPKVALQAYKDIFALLDAHLNLMRTDVAYIPPKDDTLQLLAEFALSIRHLSLEADPTFDSPVSVNTASGLRLGGGRSFLKVSKDEVQQATVTNNYVPAMAKYRDSIDIWLNRNREY